MQLIAHRAILTLTGPDTLALLERTVTHKVDDWAEGEMRYGALLTPQGKLIADYLACRTPDGVLIDVHQDAADDLMKRLKMFRLRSAVEIARDEARVSAANAEGAADPRHAALPRRVIAQRTDVAAEPLAWDALAIAAGVPEWGRDYRAAEVFPTDINMDLMGGIDYKKGCFVGQEVASRMKRKALVRKRTVRLSGTGLAAGADVRMGGASVGTVTSAAGDTGLALVRTDRLAKALHAGAALAVNDMPAGLGDDAWLQAELRLLTEMASDD